MVEYTRSLAGVEIGILLEELPNGELKGSLRSKRKEYRVDRLAGIFGGGGHVCASGFRISGVIAEVYPRLIEALRDHLAFVQSTL